MDVTELIDACREAAGADTPTRDVAEPVAAFVHQPNLPGLLGDGVAPPTRRFIGVRTSSCSTVSCPRRQRRSPPRPSDVGRHRRLPGARAQRTSSGPPAAGSTAWIASPSPQATSAPSMRRPSTPCKLAATTTSARSTSTAATSSGPRAAHGKTVSSTRWTNRHYRPSSTGFAATRPNSDAP